MRLIKNNLAVVPFLILLLVLWNHPAYSQMSPQLKEFLEGRSFPGLINAYKQDHITLINQGRKAKKIAAQPYTVEKGYRVQAFAGADMDNAKRAAEKLETLQLDSVYVVEENGMYKVQIGNFDTRREAEILLDKLKYANVKGVWIVEADIHQQKSAEERASYEQQQREQEELEQRPGFYYAIQVFATNDSLKAVQLKESFAKEFEQPVEIVNQASIWKVLIGRFYDRTAAEEYLKLIKRTRFTDAWITQVVTAS